MLRSLVLIVFFVATDTPAWTGTLALCIQDYVGIFQQAVANFADYQIASVTAV